MPKLDKVFKVEVNGTKFEEYEDNYVTLQPKLANYRGILSYDRRGNANITVVRNSDNEVMLDASLDNGEINNMDEDFFK
jgi:hypothetical protein